MAFEAFWKVSCGVTAQEKKSLQLWWSPYIVVDMNSGDVITEKNMRCIRPGLGLTPKYYDTLLGKRVCRYVKRGTAVSWELFGEVMES